MSHRPRFLQKKEDREYVPKLDPAKFPPCLNEARINVEGLNVDEELWYQWLDAGDLKQLEEGYYNKVHGRRGPIGNVTFASYVKICAAIAVRMHGNQNRREKRNMERLERMGKRNLGKGMFPDEEKFEKLGDEDGSDDDIR